MTGHIASTRSYYAIFAALLVLTALTVGAATLDLGRFNAVIALSIAMCKATLVALFFMHLRYSVRLTWLVVVAALLWLFLLIGLTMSDMLTRGWLAR